MSRHLSPTKEPACPPSERPRTPAVGPADLAAREERGQPEQDVERGSSTSCATTSRRPGSPTRSWCGRSNLTLVPTSSPRPRRTLSTAALVELVTASDQVPHRRGPPPLRCRRLPRLRGGARHRHHGRRLRRRPGEVPAGQDERDPRQASTRSGSSSCYSKLNAGLHRGGAAGRLRFRRRGGVAQADRPDRQGAARQEACRRSSRRRRRR